MSRLKTLPPLVRALSPTVAPSAPKHGASGFTRTDGRSSSARGYGGDWRKVRAAVLAQEPLCRICDEAGRVTVATQVDHIRPFRGLSDPLRLDRANLRPLCDPCHRARSARQAAGRE
jgi:5-methylcytosine-specific restriction enzyme A